MRKSARGSRESEREARGVVASPGASRREATRQEVAKRDGGARHRAASCAGTGRRQEKGGQVGWAAQVGCTVLGCGWAAR